MKLLEPLSVAWLAVSKQLFDNFRFGKWFALGFSAWLANILIGNTGNCSFPVDIVNALLKASTRSDSTSGLAAHWPQFLASAPLPGQASAPDFSQLLGGSSAMLGVIMIIIVAALLVGLVIGLVILWVGCRGQFMLLDNVLHNRDDVVRPWKEFRKHGNSLFMPFLTLSGGNLLLLFGVIVAVAVFAANPGLAQSLEIWVWVVLGLVFLLCVGVVIFLAILLMLVREVGSIWMYRNGGTAWDAMRRIAVLSMEKPLDVFLYVVARLVLGFIFWMIIVMIGIATCCIGYLPYINTVLTLPVSVFRVVYNVELVAQFGPEFDVRIPGTLTVPVPPPDAAI